MLDRVGVLQERAVRAESAARTSLADAGALKQQAAAALTVAGETESAARAQAAALAAQQAELDAELAAAEAELAGLIGTQEAAARARQQQEQARPAPVPAPTRVPAPAPLPAKKPQQPAGPGSPAAAAIAIDAALSYVGLDYAWGGGGSKGPGWGFGPDEGVWGFDCSGLTQYAYAKAGIDIPRNSRAQYAALPKVGVADLRAGDLVFWATDPSNPTTIYHVAIWLGDGSVVQAPQSNDVVKVSPMWWKGYAGAVRPGA